MMMTSESFDVQRAPGSLGPLEQEEFHRIRVLLRDRFGIHMADSKRLLMQGRLNKMLLEQGYGSYEEYVREIERAPSQERLLSLIDRISTNHSFFFREAVHFDYLSEVALPELLENAVDANDIRLWCAAAADGQEPYSIAMVLYERLGDALCGNEPCILATDISTGALQRAQEAIYPIEKITSVPAQYQKHFREVDQDHVTIGPEIRNMVLFKRLNLNQERYPFTKRFHAIFCRNVMIYFDRDTRFTLVQRLGRYIVPGGYLFVGLAESLGRNISGFHYVQPALYRSYGDKSRGLWA